MPVRLRRRAEQDGALPLPHARLRVRLQNVRDFFFLLDSAEKRVGARPPARPPARLRVGESHRDSLLLITRSLIVIPCSLLLFPLFVGL